MTFETNHSADGPYTHFRSGTAGCEIFGPTGAVIAWAVDTLWAELIVAALNRANSNKETRP
jgi:hypothetical protein